MKYLKLYDSFRTSEIMDLENELNIVDTINRNDIEGSVPLEAQYCALNPSGDFIQKFYRFKNININDGTIHKSLQYWSEQGGWYGSEFNFNGRDYNKLNTQKFLKITE